MKQRTLQWNVVKDDGGQAMTEFVIVIPIMLLLFFAMLQYFADVQTSQLGNYAAYVAARVYAVDNSVDASGSQDKAQKAAAMALAPIARPVPGEIGGPTSVGSDIGGVLNTVLGSGLGNYVAGYAMAKYVRLNSSILGGSVIVTDEGSPMQVDVTINYPQPIFVPGLAEMWNFITGDKIYTSMQPLANGLTGGVQGYNKYLGDWEYAQQEAASFGITLPNLPAIFLPYVNIQSKCSIGYANWQKYNGGPRQPPTGSDTDSTGTSTDGQAAQQKLEQSQKDEEAYKSAVNDAMAKCKAYCNAQIDLNNAHGRDDATIAKGNTKDNPGYQQAVDDLAKYQKARDDAYATSNQAQTTLTQDQQAVENDTGQPIKSVPCSCN
jgi:Flp pilus assembly protein TadG